MSAVAEFFEKIKATHATGEAREHSYRPALQGLFEAMSEGVSVINEARKTEVGAPDFIFLRDGVPVGHCEAKDIDKGLSTLKGYSVEQKARYKKAFPNLLYTNGLEFEFWREGEKLAEVRIGEPLMGMQPIPKAFDELEHLLRDFFLETPRTIHSSKRLAEMMAGKAAMIKDVIGKALIKDIEAREDSDLSGQYAAFKEHLIHDIGPAEFGDIYAETIAYGLFAARLHDPTLDTFSRIEALELLPKSNPFLRSLFGYIAGPELDDRIAWIIDDLARIFLACDLKAIMADFGKLTGQNDPFLHFYETFLAAYNPQKRKARGVWYTPEPVVRFIVRAVDEVLKTEFGLADGLADTSKIRVEMDTGQQITNKDGTIKKRGGGRATETHEVHRVQILDPATGTGTFLAEVIKQIAPKIQGVAPGMWSSYIENDLIPRLHGFELLMASYAMCHMKLDMILTELGYKPSGNPPRLSVYLTNSLEEGEHVEQNLFAQWFTREAKGANRIKRDMPIMCVIGNPPYSGHSSNKGAWIEGLMQAYKQSSELKRPAQAKWLSDDYVKFIRLAEHLIETNGEGVLGFITNHAYLDNPTFLDMRHHLMKSFDQIYVLDLHGSSKKKELSPDGTPDKNVFDIQQGVAIIIATKTKTPSIQIAKVRHADFWGTRKTKYDALNAASLSDAIFTDVTPKKAPWLFRKSDWKLRETYYEHPGIQDWFSPNGRPAPGIVTTHDQFAISWSEAEMISKVESFLSSESESDARSNWRLCSQDQWNYGRAKSELSDRKWLSQVQRIAYRPFDVRFTVYNQNVAVHRRERASRHLLNPQNIAILTTKANRDPSFAHALVTDTVPEVIGLSPKTASNAMVFPLYLYPAEDELDQTRRVNFDDKLYAKLRKLATHPEHGEPDEVAVFDYIYGVLHAPNYRETFAEFLKIDFPRIPWPQSPDVFWAVREKGEALRRLHLMEDESVGETPFPFLGEGEPVVDKPDFQATRDGLGEVWINGDMRFSDVPEIAWGFYIGGYQPARKWLKDRKGRPLSFDDIRHYQKIIKILSETDRIMKEIELPLDLPEDA